MYLGDFPQGRNIRFHFSSRNASGPQTLAGSPVVSVYKENSLTQSITGVTLTADFDGVTGLNFVNIDTGADGTFYSDDAMFTVVITAGTVGGVSVVGEVVGRFVIRAQALLYPTTAGRKLDVSATGEAGLDWANIGSPTTVQGLSGTTIKTATDVETDTADIQTRLPAALVGGRMDSDAVAISGSTVAADAVEANIGNLDATVSSRLATAGYTAPPTAAANADAVWDEARAGHVAAGSFGEGVASVQGNVTGSVASVTADVGITQAGADKVWTSAARTLTSFGTLVADIWAAVVDSSGVTTLLSRLTAGRATNLDNLDATVSSRLATAGYTAPPTAAANADAVWDEAIAGHLTAGSTGAALNAAGSAGDPWTTPLPGAYGAGTAGKIIGTNLDAAVSSRASQTSVDAVPTNAELTTALGTADDATLAAIAALNDVTAAEVVTAIKAGTVAELTAGAYPTTPTIEQALSLLVHMLARGGTFTKATGVATVRNAAGGTILQRTDTDDGFIFTEGALGAP